MPAELEVRRAATGHLFVRPTVVGEPRGWFAFDTGAAASAVDPAVVEACGFESLGEVRLQGAGAGAVTARLVAGGPLTLGPLELERLHMVETGLMQELASLVGEESIIAGILGWDVLAQSVVEMDLVEGRILLHDPSRYRLPDGGHWEPLVLHRKHPFVRARFEGEREGLFCLDAGAGSMSVVFHTPTVDALGLLEGRETQAIEAYGAGGALALEAGSLAWFEVAGRRLEEPTVLFSRDDHGAFADTDSAGNLGQAFFDHVRVVFDYQRARVAYVPK